MTDDQQRARELREQLARRAVYFSLETCAEIAAALRAAPEWEPIDTAPKDDRVLVRCESGSVYAAHWVQNPMTGDEAWLVCALEDGTQMLVHPVEWLPLPVAARPQGVK